MEVARVFVSAWRQYCVHEGSSVMLMLSDSGKSSQTGDIQKARQLAKELNPSRRDNREIFSSCRVLCCARDQLG